MHEREKISWKIYLVDSIGDLLQLVFRNFQKNISEKKNLRASTMLQVKLLRFVDNVRLSGFMHKITGTHFDEFGYEYSSHNIMLFCLKGTFHKRHFLSLSHCSVFKFPLSLSKCKTLPVFKRLLIELEPLIADYSRSV